MQKTILCYGDSNTWGYVPQPLKKDSPIYRYPRDQRWTGIVQKVMGDDYYIVEEGLNSRTTNLDYEILPDRNGKTYLPSCLYSHAPIDLVILALGTNDLKLGFNRTPEDIRDGLLDLIGIIQSSMYGKALQVSPKILILPLVIPLPIAEQFYDDEKGVLVLEGAINKAMAVVPLYAELSKAKNCYFLDTSKDVFPSSIDGVHYDADAHKKLADMLVGKINDIFA